MSVMGETQTLMTYLWVVYLNGSGSLALVTIGKVCHSYRVCIYFKHIYAAFTLVMCLNTKLHACTQINLFHYWQQIPSKYCDPPG